MKRTLFSTILLLVILISACSQTQPLPASTVTPQPATTRTSTPTQVPALTSTFTPTFQPTKTYKPTLTSLPTLRADLAVKNISELLQYLRQLGGRNWFKGGMNHA